eukprot:7937860-Ditylum_brightwellii.AAC.1
MDISMQYYTFELDDESQDVCTICNPFGMHKCKRLTMGIKCSPDFVQAAMDNALHVIKGSDMYIDDVGAFSNDWESHNKLIDEVLCRLHEKWFHH